MTIEELKAEISDLCVIRNNEIAAIAKARGKRRAALIEAHRPTLEAIRTAQRAIVALRRSEAAQ
jgi:hypothetical protein